MMRATARVRTRMVERRAGDVEPWFPRHDSAPKSDELRLVGCFVVVVVEVVGVPCLKGVA